MRAFWEGHTITVPKMSIFQQFQSGVDGDESIVPVVKESDKKKEEEIKIGEKKSIEEEKLELINYEGKMKEIGSFLRKFLTENPQKKKRTVVFKDKEDKIDIPIKLLHFYNTLGDNPVKVQLLGKSYVFKQRNALWEDSAAMNLFNLLNEHWEEKNVNAEIHTYNVIPMSNSVVIKGKREFVFGGFVEFVSGECLMNIFKKDLIKIICNSPHGKEKQLELFLRSLVGSTIGNWLCGLYDRHQFNILLTSEGKICHIDLDSVFGHKTPFDELSSDIGTVKIMPSIWFPKRIENFLKDEKIKKFRFFLDEVDKAFKTLPKFSEICKCLNTEYQKKFVHDKMYHFTGDDIKSKIILTPIHKHGVRKFRDFLARTFQQGPSKLSLKGEDSFHIVSKNIYRVSPNGLHQLEESSIGGWDSMICPTKGSGNDVYLISFITGILYCVSTDKYKFRKISISNWSHTKGCIFHDGYLYILCQKKLYKMNVTDGYWKAISSAKILRKAERTVFHNGKLYLFNKEFTESLYFDPKNLKIVDLEKTKDLPKVAKFLLSIGGYIYFVNKDSTIHGYDVEKKTCECLTKKQKWTVKASTVSGKEIVLVCGDGKVRMFNVGEKKFRHLELVGDSWGNASLAF